MHSNIILCLKDPHSQPSVDWPPEVHRKPTSNPTQLSQSQNAHNSITTHHTAHTRAHLISCVGGATTPPHTLTHFTPSLPFFRPYSPHNHTGVVCLINCHGLTAYHAHQGTWQGSTVRGHTGRGTRPPIITSRCGSHKPAMPRPIGGNKTCIKAHTHCTQDLGHAHKLH